MNIHETLTSALSAVLPNTWLTELPPNPSWPALVFNVASEQEKGWVLGGGYDLHSIEVVIMSRSRTEITTLQSAIVAAMEALDGYMGEESQGDAAYEGDPRVYAYVMNFSMRTRR